MPDGRGNDRPDPGARWLAAARMEAVRAQLGSTFWFSHESAAILWGCEVLGPCAATHLTQPGRPSTGGDRALVRHHGPLPPTQRATVAGLPVTSLERTVVDCALTLAGGPALAVADSALYLGADRQEIKRLLDERHGRRGVVRARRVIERADARAESGVESLIRWTLAEVGLGDVELQVEVDTSLGPYVLALGWSRLKVGLRFDGDVRYSGAHGSGAGGVAGAVGAGAVGARGVAGAAGVSGTAGVLGAGGVMRATDAADAARAVHEAKCWDDAAEAEGWSVVHLTWEDFRLPGRLAGRARVALRRAVAQHARVAVRRGPR